jgi:hypothetical protein
LCHSQEIDLENKYLSGRSRRCLAQGILANSTNSPQSDQLRCSESTPRCETIQSKERHTR